MRYNYHHTIHDPQTSSRSFNTPFQPDPDRDVFVTYSVFINVAAGTEGKVELRSDAGNPPTEVRAQARARVGALIADAVGFGTVLSFIVPAGDFVELATVEVSGTPTFSLDAQTERRL